MNHSMINAMVSMNSMQQKLDILANNMANLNTTGFKRKEATFEDVLNNIKEQPQSFRKEGRLTPLGFNQGWGTKLSQVSVNFQQGTFKDTGISTDLAIEGDGLFKVRVPDGDPEQPARILYTRDGGFQLTRLDDAQAAEAGIADTGNLYLANQEGHLLLDENDNPIAIPAEDKIRVDADGTVWSYSGSNPEEGAVEQGRIGLVRILRPQFLQQVGDNLFTVPEGTAANAEELAAIVRPIAQDTALDKPISVKQGFLEQSNVNLADEMTELMMVQRAFQLGSRALTSADTMMGLANNLRG
ncbi:flagellar hook-basal body protein [Paenibacillus sp. YN15]|uniref:flagellar hook-basal body protein n=1 Tax=Paenibacillus sp. YN15 TaxID=1742774 RepID=UPI000DCD8AB8|nr:flagellar hook-basal body protein [Paenibacillus sp. YN15]RAV03128.1 flagellar hook-basal body protein [Paenibacillus sp. YN15]